MRLAPAGGNRNAIDIDSTTAVGIGTIAATLIAGLGAALITRKSPPAPTPTPPAADPVINPSPIPNAPNDDGDTPLSHRERVQRDGILRAGAVKHPPLCDFTYDGDEQTYSGLYVEMAQRVAEILGVNLQLVAVDWSEISGVFENSECDLVLSVFETRARAAYADFVAPFHKIGVSGVIRTGSEKVKELSDLAKGDVRIAVTKGEAGWEYVVVDLRVPKRRLIVVENSDLSMMMSHIQTGLADVAIVDDVTCARVVGESNGALSRVFDDDPVFLFRNAVMVPRGDPEFASWIDTAFIGARAVPTVETLEQQTLVEWSGLIRRYR